MIKESNISLKHENTFGIDVNAKAMYHAESRNDLEDLFQKDVFKTKYLILGGGSNVLFLDNFDGNVIKNEIKGIDIIDENNSEVLVESGGGENWHSFVLHSLEKGWGGLENLSLIPGTVGAAPMQNIGAYGVEIKDVFHSLDAFNLKTGKTETFNLEECEFDYRSSVFKTRAKGNYFITKVRFTLNKYPVLNLEYGMIKDILEKSGISEPTIRDVSNAVISIRQSKLPDPRLLGNAGSFFKNPVINKTLFKKLKSEYDDIPGYEIDSETIKVPAAWFIEKSGWKGKRIGNTGSHSKQALVIVNYGEASGKEIFELSTRIQDHIKEQFGIELQREVNVVE